MIKTSRGGRKAFFVLGMIALFALFFAGCDMALTGSDSPAEDSLTLAKKPKPPVPVEPVVIEIPESAVVSIEGPKEFPLIAGKKNTVGRVVLDVSGTDLLVTYETDPGIGLNEITLWVGAELAFLPDTRKGNPKVGHFPYKAEKLGGVQTYTVTIPLSRILDAESSSVNVLYAAAHAEVVYLPEPLMNYGGRHGDGKHDPKKHDNGKHDYHRTEGAWAGTERLVPGRGSWATYFSFTLLVTIREAETFETAYAFGTEAFLDVGVPNPDNEWGWVSLLNDGASGTVPLYARAFGNNTGIAVQVGEFSYSYTGGLVQAGFTMYPGYTLKRTELYAAGEPPFDIFVSPASYGQITHDNPGGAVSDSFADVDAGVVTPVYLVGRAWVYGLE